MSKEYLDRVVLEEDLKLVVGHVKSDGSLLSTPSNIADVYDLKTYRSASSNQGVSLKSIVDNNVVTRVLPFVNGEREKDKHLSNAERAVCALMCFMIHSGIETNPVSAILERPSGLGHPTKETEDYQFRIADHLHPQIFADLALGKITSVPDEFLKEAKNAVDQNAMTQEDIARTKYSTNKDMGWYVLYLNLLKAWLLYRTQPLSRLRLEMYLNWSVEKSLCDPVSLTFMSIFLSEKRLPKMIKKPNTDQSHIIFENLKNVAWDLYHLSFLIQMNDASDQKQIWFLCSRDKLLAEILPYIWLQSDFEKVKTFARQFYSKKAIKPFHRYYLKTNSRENRGEYLSKVKLNTHSEITSLENECRELLA